MNPGLRSKSALERFEASKDRLLSIAHKKISSGQISSGTVWIYKCDLLGCISHRWTTRPNFEHKRTGYLAHPFDTQDLAAGISWVLDHPQRRICLGHAARQLAERLWNTARVEGMYAEREDPAIAADLVSRACLHERISKGARYP